MYLYICSVSFIAIICMRVAQILDYNKSKSIKEFERVLERDVRGFPQFSEVS